MEIYFNVKKVKKIVFTKKEHSGYKFVSGVPEKQKYFLGIPFGKTKSTKEGWYKDGYYFYDYDEIKNRDFLIIENNELFYKSKLVIYLSNHDAISKFYNTDEEAKAKIEDIKNANGLPFALIKK